MSPRMRGCAKCGSKRGGLPASLLSKEENEMKTVEILSKAGVIAVRERDLRSYRSRGCTMRDGSEIVTVEEKAAAKKAKENKKKPKE